MANVPISNLTTTWNASGTTFTGFKLNVTDTASAAGSLLADFQIGGVSQAFIGKTGIANFGQDSSNRVRVGYNASPPAGQDGIGLWAIGGGRLWLRGYANLYFGGAGRLGEDSVGGLGWTSSAAGTFDLTLYRDAANTLAQRNGVNAQTFRLYNTYTDASNYERGFMRWNSNVLEIGAEGAGTGANRIVSFFANGSSVASIGLGVAPGVASADANHSWLSLRNGMGIAQVSNTMRVFTNSQDHNTDIGGNNATFPQLRVTRDAVIFSRFTMSATDTFRIYIQDENGQDKAHKNLQINPEDAGTANTVNITGGNLVLRGGAGASASSGEANGGNVTIRGGTGYGTGRNGLIIMDNLPTTNPTVAGALWNNSGVLSVSAG